MWQLAHASLSCSATLFIDSTLLDCEVNLSLKVSRVGDQSRDFLQLVERRGLKPGSRLRVEGRDEAADAVELRLEGG